MPFAPRGSGGCRSRCSTSRSSAVPRPTGSCSPSRRGERVAVGVVLHPLVERLRRTWAMPPCCWPRTSNGLRMRRSLNGDVPLHRDVAVGLRVDLDHGHVRAERERRVRSVEVAFVLERRGLEPSGRRAASRDAAARSDHSTVRAGTPATPSPPCATTTSSTLASSMCAAICLARASTSVDATCTALPAVCSERDPSVPAPLGTFAVSELISEILSIGMPSMSLTIMAKAVWVTLAVHARADRHRRRAVVVHLDRARTPRADRAARDLDVRRHNRCRARSDRRQRAASLARRVARRSPPRRAPRRAPSRTHPSRTRRRWWW